MRGAFYYPWYPEQWSAAGHRFDSVIGEYDSGNHEVVSRHVVNMVKSKMDFALYSWWGRGSATDLRFREHLTSFSFKPFKWAVYYELDQNHGDQTAVKIEADLRYLESRYFHHPNYLWLKGKPAVFVYIKEATQAEGPGIIFKWAVLRNSLNLYINMTDVSEWFQPNLINSIDGWHGYDPAVRTKSVFAGIKVYSLSISAGFWANWEETPRLIRDPTAFTNAVRGVSTFRPDFELYYWNEHGEGSPIEPCVGQADYVGILGAN